MAISTLQSGMGWFPQQAGGLNRMYYNLLHHLPSAGVDVHGLVTGQDLPNNGTPVRSFAPTEASLLGRCAQARLTAQRLLVEENPDLVASHFALYTLPWLDLIGDRTFVVHFHGPWALEGAVERTTGLGTWAKRRVEQMVYNRADHFIVLSTAFKELLCDTYDVDPARVSIVPGGVDVDAFADAPPRLDARAQLGWPPDRPIIFAVRRLARRMGLTRLIDAMANVRRHVPDALLCIAGQGPLYDTLQAQIEAHDLTEHVRLLGFIPDADLRLAYRAADLSIVPTTALEGFGLITVESLAAGTPVLVTPVGGLPEVVRPLSKDLVLSGTDTSALTTGLLSALLAPEHLPTTRACTRYARRHFDWPIIAQQTRDVYAHVLHAHV